MRSFVAALSGRLEDPPADLNEQGPFRRTILHYACFNANNGDLVIRLIRGGADVNARDVSGRTPLHWACRKGCVDLIPILCVMGADINVGAWNNRTPLDESLAWCTDSAFVLIANGARLTCALPSHQSGLEEFQQQVIELRSTVIALLAMKKGKGAARLQHVDRFLLREMAVALWAQRYEFY